MTEFGIEMIMDDDVTADAEAENGGVTTTSSEDTESKQTEGKGLLPVCSSSACRGASQKGTGNIAP